MMNELKSRKQVYDLVKELGIRLVIVEGARGSGKTYFINKLAEEMGAKVYSTGGDRKKFLEDQKSGRVNFIEGKLDIRQGALHVLDFIMQVGLPEVPVIFDRSYHSTWVFNDRYDPDSQIRSLDIFDPREKKIPVKTIPGSRLMLYHGRLRAMRALVILKRSLPDTLQERASHRPVDIPTEDLIEEQRLFKILLDIYAIDGGMAVTLDGEK